MISMSQNTKQWVQAGALSVLLALPSLAMAAGGLNAGSGSELIELIRGWTNTILLIYGAGAAVFLIFKGIMTKVNEGSWMDYVKTCAWTAIIGGSIKLAEYLFTLFK